ncbi:MAG: winged helix-turn-helix domain-containing protein [Parvularcula sp.]|nr:winged helix-turn-helix domain-containing protein [Parvularcula sp.]
MTSFALSPFFLGDVRADPARGVIEGGASEQRVEPKVMDLLVALAEADGEVVSRSELFAKLWPDVVVGEDTLSRTVSKLRRALGEDPKTPRYLETVPKRGYRLMAPVRPETSAPRAEKTGKSFSARRRPLLGAGAAALVLALVGFVAVPRSTPVAEDIELAKDRYMRFTRTDNEAAISLYERALREADPAAEAEAGMAAALVQRVVRWPETIGSEAVGSDSLEKALRRGSTKTPEAKETLRRAKMLAERSVRRNPKDPDTWRVLGLVQTAEGEIEAAKESYREGLRRDPMAWGIQINLAELLAMEGKSDEAYKVLTDAYDAMAVVYRREPQRTGPWRAPLGVLIARLDEEKGRPNEAEAWYRRTLTDAPFDKDATEGLARLMAEQDRIAEAQLLCSEYETRTGETLVCPA